MDVAAALDQLVPAAVYSGSLTANTQESYEGVQWNDERAKPSWTELSVVVVQPPLAETLESIFRQGLQQLASVVPAAIRWNLFTIQAAGEKALLAGDTEALRDAIEKVPLPDNEQVEAIRQTMLEKLS